VGRRTGLKLSLVAEAIGIPTATMKWKFYWRDIVRQHRVIIDGWPTDIPLGNISDVATSLPALERLHYSWSTGTTKFRPIDDAELQMLETERQQNIESGKENEPEPRKVRCDKGIKRKAGQVAEVQRNSAAVAPVIEGADGSDHEMDA
jgi:hypothetical protein